MQPVFEYRVCIKSFVSFVLCKNVLSFFRSDLWSFSEGLTFFESYEGNEWKAVTLCPFLCLYKYEFKVLLINAGNVISYSGYYSEAVVITSNVLVN